MSNTTAGTDSAQLIVGLGNLGEALLLRMVKNWQIDPPSGGAKLRVVVVDRLAEQRRRDFERMCPGLLENADVQFLAADIHDPQLPEQLVQSVPGGAGFRAAFVCIDNDAQGLHAAAAVRQLLGAAPPIIVRMSQQTGLANVLGASAARGGVVPGVIPVGLLDITCELRYVLGGTREILAQAIHEGYVADQLAGGVSPDNNDSLAPWHCLADDLKESNRQQADHIQDKLARIGCRPSPRASYPFTLLEFTAEEVELLAELEHQRWRSERTSAGWRYGAKKDVELKLNPCLVPWNKLPEEAKAYNRDAVRRIPKVLARADIEIRRDEPLSSPNAPAVLSLQPRRRAGKPQAA